ncbi:IS110 family transposase [Streptomyces sp. NPDC001093]|uniref:IS110 family transposase n=1 Tax=Streptomyces sp. NPDC001093 TaxID=3154376 RepID=UPI00331EB41A
MNIEPLKPVRSVGRSSNADEVILGVDTHRDTHVAAVLSKAGNVLAAESFPATASGYRQLVEWAVRLGVVRRAGVECSGNYGAALSRYLLSQGIEVIEAPGPGRSARRRRRKSDQGDAEAAARSVLSGRARSPAKSGSGPAEIARMYMVAKDSAVKAQRQAVNQLKAILVTADPALREELANLPRRALIQACLQLSEGGEETDPVLRATRFTLHALAERIEQLRAQARVLERRLSAVIGCHYPRLVDAVGIGPHSAAVLLTAIGENSDRMRGEASFAALCGASPVEYSSGSRQHRRLNRGGNRQANAALHRVVLSRLRWDPRTQTYYERRVLEGKTRREIIRCLKRYVAREVYRLVQEERRSPGWASAG